MKDWLLLPVMAAVFAFGFYIVKRLDAFIAENQRLIAESEHLLNRRICIAAEFPGLLDDISTALEYCSDQTPYLEFLLCCGARSKLLRKLADGTVDIALVTEDLAPNLDPAFQFIRIPRQTHAASACGLPVEELDAGSDFAVVWNKDIASKERDRVVFMVETELCALRLQ